MFLLTEELLVKMDPNTRSHPNKHYSFSCGFYSVLTGSEVRGPFCPYHGICGRLTALLGK